VYQNGDTNSSKYLQKELHQESVHSPILFNIYTANLVVTEAKKYIYVDDIGLVSQANSLNRYLITLLNYFRKWHLTLNPSKIVVINPHLNNREASRRLKLNR